MKELLNIRFLCALVYIALPLIGCLIAGGYLVIKEEVTKWTRTK